MSNIPFRKSCHLQAIDTASSKPDKP